MKQWIVEGVNTIVWLILMAMVYFILTILFVDSNWWSPA
tara:strand:+ start:306 stop:422 length:117 start_codon:yes stop_codon:yes gene_type:complete